MFYSVHLYGADVQLLQWETDSLEEAKVALIELMKDVRFKEDEDDVKLYQINQNDGDDPDVICRDSVVVFDYKYDYLDDENRK